MTPDYAALAQRLRDGRRTIDGTDSAAVRGAASTRNNGRYNGNGREWRTPDEIFDPLHAEFGFTLDPCATAENAKCAKFFSEADDGLAQNWGTERVFMNPPYGREIYAWARKAREAAVNGALVVGLLPASTDLRWWHEDVVGHAEVRYVRGRVRFLTGGLYRASGFFASVIVIWRPAAAASSLDRLAGMEAALRGLVDAIHERADGDDPDRNVYLEELEAELATARRALEGTK